MKLFSVGNLLVAIQPGQPTLHHKQANIGNYSVAPHLRPIRPSHIASYSSVACLNESAALLNSDSSVVSVTLLHYAE